MNKRKKLAGIVLPAFLFVLVVIIAWRNFTPGTFLTGWDSLHPEFNFPLYFKRAFFGVWRADQGLGSIAAHAHMADIPRAFFLWILDIALPVNILRYVFIFLSLFLGPLGVYFFVAQALNKKDKWVKMAAFTASLFYIFNLGTVQHFFVPFDMFIVLYGLLPWAFLFSLKFLNLGRKRDLVWLLVVNIFLASSAYAPALFYVYLASLLIFMLSLSLLKRKGFKRSLVVLFSVVAVNLYWLLPNIYSAVSQSETIRSSTINRLFTSEAILRNQDYGGDVTNILVHKGLLFSWLGYDFESGRFVDLLGAWQEHLNNEAVNYISLTLSGLWILGLILSVIKKNKAGIALIPVSLFLAFFLVGENTSAYRLVAERFPLIGEALRMSFTKFSIPFMFTTSIFFGFAFEKIFNLSKKRIASYAKALVFVLTVLMLLFYGKPMFEGELISEKVRVDIPEEYFQTYNWFGENPGRIAKVPLNNRLNWELHNWGYEGSGWFTWFTAENPQLDRDFDRWSSYNESFYNEASYALYNKDIASFERVLEKYQVTYLLLDESIINAGGNGRVLFIDEFKSLANNSSKISKVEEFGFLVVYKTNFEVGEKYVWTPENYKLIDADLTYSQIDPIYSTKTAYVASGEGVKYPFVNLDKRQGVEVSLQGEALQFSSPLKTSFQTEVMREDLSKERGFASATNCDLKKLGSVTKERVNGEVKYGAYDGGVSCDFFYYPEMERERAYVLKVKGENLKGRGLKIYLFNPETGRMDLEELLPEGRFDEYFFILPSKTEDAADQPGYTLNVETRSFGKVASENVIEGIEIAELPLGQLTAMTSGGTLQETKNNLQIKEVEKWGTSHYFVDTENEGLLVLGQGYENGWMAFEIGEEPSFLEKLLPWFFGEPLEHVIVNNWQNGWIVSNSGSIEIVFLPQYLEWFGFVLVFVVILLLLTKVSVKV